MSSNESDKYALLLEIETHNEAVTVATDIEYYQIIANKAGRPNLLLQFGGSLPPGFLDKFIPSSQSSSGIGMNFGKLSKCLIRKNSHKKILFPHHHNLPHLLSAIDEQRVDILSARDKLAIIVAAIPCGIP